MSLAVFSKISKAIDLYESMPGYHMAHNNDGILTLSSDPLRKLSTPQIIDSIIKQLAAFALQPEIPEKVPEDFFSTLRKKVIGFLKSDTCQVDKKSPQFRALKNVFFPLAEARWKLQKGYAKAPIKAIPVDEAVHGEKLLSKKKISIAKADFLIISCPRDLLFIEKQTLHHIKRFITLQLEVATRVNTWLEKGYKVSYVGQPEEGPTAVFFDAEETGVLELGLQQQTQRACTRLVKNGDELSVDEFVRKVVAYKKQEECKEKFYDSCIDILETNELLSSIERVFEGWRRVEFAAEALTDVTVEDHLFESRSYLPRKRLHFLLRMGKNLFSTMYFLSKSAPQERFSTSARIATVCLEMIRQFEAKIVYNDDLASYTLLTDWISGAVQKSKNTRANHQRFFQMFFDNDDSSLEGEEEYECYNWNETDAQAYKCVIDAIHGLNKPAILRVQELVKKFELGGFASKDAWLTGCIQPKPKGVTPAVAKPKKRKATVSPPSNSRTPSPETMPPIPQRLPSVDELADSMAQVALSAPVTAKTTHVHKAQKVDTVVQTSAPVTVIRNKYAWKTMRWWQPMESSRHPFREDPKYMRHNFFEQSKIGFWICLEHNFGLAVDNYLSEGARTTDKKLLKKHDVIERIQLFGEIRVVSAAVNEVRTGVFTYGRGKSGLMVHRSFTTLEREDIINGNYIQRGWEVIAKAAEKLKEVPGEPEAQVMGSDGSALKSITENLITITDPKNFATIILVRMKE